MAQKMFASSFGQLQAHSRELNCFGTPLSVLAILKGQQGVRKEESGMKGLQVLPWRNQLVKLIFLMK